MDKKYGGYTADELREFIADSEFNSEGLDSLFGDDAVSANVIRDLLDALSAPAEAKRGTDAQILFERKLTCEAINGAMAFGYQNTNPPPSDDEWLAPYWKIGRERAEAEATQAVAVPEGWMQGVEAVARMLDKKADDYANEHGHVDPDTGAMEFGTGHRALAKLEYWSELSELAEEVRAMLAAAPQAPVADAEWAEPVAWQPIETAPRGAKGYCWMNLAWGPEGDKSTGVGMRWGDRFFSAASFYCSGQEKLYEFREFEVKPTHWMPLPPAPDAAPAQQAVSLTDDARDAARWRMNLKLMARKHSRQSIAEVVAVVDAALQSHSHSEGEA